MILWQQWNAWGFARRDLGPIAYRRQWNPQLVTDLAQSDVRHAVVLSDLTNWLFSNGGIKQLPFEDRYFPAHG
jgi:hypothetical protein